MHEFYSKLKKVPALNKEELFFYIVENSPDTILKIVTNAGLVYSGRIVNIGITKEEGITLILQLIEDKGIFTERVLHIAIKNIESTELFNKKEITNILSKGEITGEEYEMSGKLEVKRETQLFADTILKMYDLNIGVPQITLPEDGFVLNRILKLTRIIQQVIIELLKEEDARAAWKTKYNEIVFIDNKAFDVTGINKALHIYYPFNDLDASLITQKELTIKLMSVL